MQQDCVQTTLQSMMVESSLKDWSVGCSILVNFICSLCILSQSLLEAQF